MPGNAEQPTDPPRGDDGAAENDATLLNDHYERPATLALAGDVAGRRILDAGCGSGALFAQLRDRGATVTGVDLSAGVLQRARRRLGADADLRVADLACPLPFPDDAFDDVIASLVLHHLEDWEPTLTELRRVLTPGGRLIVSVDHPFAINLMHRLCGDRPNYFATYGWTDEFTDEGAIEDSPSWHRPLHAMTDAFASAGFRVSVISEPQPAPAARELFPDDFRLLTALPAFLFFVLHAEPPGSMAG